MLGNIGGAELALIMMVVLLVFGAKRIPEIARGLGQGIREFRKATSEISRELKLEDELMRRPHPESAARRPAPVYRTDVTRPETATGPAPE